MSPQSFLRSLLLIPLVVPLLALGLEVYLDYAGVHISGAIKLNTLVLISSLVLGGVPYLITATLVWFRIGRCTSRKSALVLIFTTPLIFIPLQALAMLLWSLLHSSVGASLVDGFEEGLMLALITVVYGLIFGYFYAICSALIFIGAVRLRLVPDFATIKVDGGY
jgi:hypothetical protein